MSVRLEDDHEILDPIVQGYKPYQKSDWMKYFRYRLYVRRGKKCDLCGKPLYGFDLHEALFSRRWLPRSKQLCLFTEYNCLVLHRECHIPFPPLKDRALEILIGYYGRERLREWMERLPFKEKPDLLNRT